MDKKYTVGILTLGCKVNQYESEAISEALEICGFEIRPWSEKCDAYVINTCTVTAESDRKARQMIRRVMSKDKNAYILVTGCYSQISPDSIAEIEGVDYICGNSNKMSVVDKLCKLVKCGKNSYPEICVPSLEGAGFEHMAIKKFERTRAYVKIEDGCESKCTYCTIPAARGGIRSKPKCEVVKEVTELIRGGCCEVVLTGIETGSYGRDLGGEVDLADLLCSIDKIDGINRVRLGSLDPTVIKPNFVKKIKDLSSIAPHFHLSLQSGSDRVLAAMKRKYNSDGAMRSIERLREAIPGVQFTTDVIVGFPGESEEDFRSTCDFVKQAGFLMIHVFPYSKRKGTPAAYMKDQIDESVKKERVRILSEIGNEIRSRVLDSKISQSELTEVLFETYTNGYAYGHTADFVEVRVKSDRQRHGELARVRLISHDGNVCDGVICEK